MPDRLVRYTGSSDVREIEHEGVLVRWSAENGFAVQESELPEGLLALLESDGCFQRDPA